MIINDKENPAKEEEEEEDLAENGVDEEEDGNDEDGAAAGGDASKKKKKNKSECRRCLFWFLMCVKLKLHRTGCHAHSLRLTLS